MATLLVPAVWLFVGVCASQPLLAQSGGSSGVSVTYEAARDRFHYRFENPSSFDTVDLVPHEFTQTYWGDNQWLVLHGRVHAGGRLFETELAATPQRSTRGDDYDTFFQPSGDVVVVGTTGNVSMRSWRIRQRIGLGRRGGMDWSIGYQYRSDRSRFHPGSKTTTHTQPSSMESLMVLTRETTISRNYGAQLQVARAWNVSRWRMGLEVDTAPATNARLTTLLPDKYPGMTIVFNAIVATMSSRVTVTRGNRWPVTVSAGYTRTFSYLRSRRFVRNAAVVGLGIGLSHH